jgi:hypothetical protein
MNPSTAPEKPVFDSAEAFNTKGFAEFLAQHDDAESFDLDDADAIEARYKTYKNKEKAADGMVKFISTELKDQGLGIKFDDPELIGHIKEQMHSMALENPEKMGEIFEAVTEFDRLGKEIAQVEAKISELGEKGKIEETLAELEKKEGVLDKASDEVSWDSRFVTNLYAFFGSEDGIARKGARVATQQEYGIKLDTEAISSELYETRQRIADMKKAITSLDQLEAFSVGAKERNAELEGILGAAFGANEAIHKMAREKVDKKLGELMKSKPDEAQKFLDTLRSVNGEGALAIDYFDVKGKEKDLQQRIDARIEQQILLDMQSVIEKTPLGDKSYDKLTKSLKAFVDRQEVGSKKGDDARRFVLKSLEEVAQQVAPKDKARSLLVRFMISKIAK